jgi:hypothetical protein
VPNKFGTQDFCQLGYGCQEAALSLAPRPKYLLKSFNNFRLLLLGLHGEIAINNFNLRLRSTFSRFFAADSQLALWSNASARAMRIGHRHLASAACIFNTRPERMASQA